MDRSGLILIKKYDFEHKLWNRIAKAKPQINLSLTDIIEKFKGFEGEMVNIFEPGDKYGCHWMPMEDFKKVELYYLKEFLSPNYILLKISNYDIENLNSSFIFGGYDYGIAENEFNLYSSIFNEVLLGTIDELVGYKKELNGNLLFPTYEIANKYEKTHKYLEINGKSVETDDYEMRIYKVWFYKR